METEIDEKAMIAAAMDSVALLNAGKPEGMSDEDWADTKQRNADHLAIVAEKVTLSKAEQAAFDKAIG